MGYFIKVLVVGCWWFTSAVDYERLPCMVPGHQATGSPEGSLVVNQRCGRVSRPRRLVLPLGWWLAVKTFLSFD
ncbi:MAG: hypothetical protein ACHBN1_35745 [Heteroscytonema crispum UTEX LB 1556]